MAGAWRRARALFTSLTRLRALRPDTAVLPAHASEPIAFGGQAVAAQMGRAILDAIRHDEESAMTLQLTTPAFKPGNDSPRRGADDRAQMPPPANGESNGITTPHESIRLRQEQSRPVATVRQR